MPRVPLTELRSRGSQSIDVQMAPGSRLCAGTAVDSAAERVTEGVIGFGEEGATAQAPVRPSAWQRERSFRPRPALPIRRASSGSSQLVSLRAESRRDPPSRRDPRVGRQAAAGAAHGARWIPAPCPYHAQHNATNRAARTACLRSPFYQGPSRRRRRPPVALRSSDRPAIRVCPHDRLGR